MHLQKAEAWGLCAPQVPLQGRVASRLALYVRARLLHGQVVTWLAGWRTAGRAVVVFGAYLGAQLCERLLGRIVPMVTGSGQHCPGGARHTAGLLGQLQTVVLEGGRAAGLP